MNPLFAPPQHASLLARPQAALNRTEDLHVFNQIRLVMIAFSLAQKRPKRSRTLLLDCESRPNCRTVAVHVVGPVGMTQLHKLIVSVKENSRFGKT